MKRPIKIILTVAAALILCATLSGCRKTEVAERAFVEAVGLDRNGENLNVTFQILDSDKETVTSYILTGKGKTFTEAFADAEQGQVRKLFLGHCKAIILGEGISDIRAELEYFLNSNRISPGVKLMLAEGKAESLVTGETDFPRLLKQSVECGNVPDTDMVRFFEQCDGVLLPVISEVNDEILIQTCGLVTNGICDGTLSPMEAKGTAILSGNFKAMPVAVNTSKGSGAVTVTDVSANFIPQVTENKSVLKVTLKVSGKAEEGLHDIPKKEIEQAVGLEVEKLCASALMKSSETGTDFLLLKWKMKRSSPIPEREFRAFLKNMEVEITVNSNIEPQRNF